MSDREEIQQRVETLLREQSEHIAKVTDINIGAAFKLTRETMSTDLAMVTLLAQILTQLEVLNALIAGLSAVGFPLRPSPPGTAG